MINIYGPQNPLDKVTLWNTLLSFIQQHPGKFILFGDLNEVKDESERLRSTFNRSEAQDFKSFIADSGLTDLPLAGHLYTWMNKDGSKLSKRDHFLISNPIIDDNPDLKAVILDRRWSDHSPILLDKNHTDYGPIPIKFFHSWLKRVGIHYLIKTANDELMANHSGTGYILHHKFKFFKARL
ncbi:RNA-directed DNA polymerase, eukaryota [Artemisia annua]|nr:RNA-directed DNA polymerase, eukaryota [Artemisia annua]